jgi:hypothetical protein
VKSPNVTISKTPNNTIKFSGLDLTMIQALGSDSASTSAWQSLIPVYKMPADTDLKDYQPVQPGKYAVQDSSVIFTPDTPLQKGQTYFVRYYHFAQGSTLWQHIKDRRKMSSEPYTDLILKR